jgi:GntR family transcriptional regulator
VIEEHYQLVVRVAVLAQTTGTASKSEQERLRLGESDPVLRVTRVRSEDGSPLAYELVVLPLKLFPGLVSNGEIGSDTLGLARRQGLQLGLAVESMSTTEASEPVAASLGVAPGSRVKMLDRVVSTVDGQPVEWRVAFTREDHAG